MDRDEIAAKAKCIAENGPGAIHSELIRLLTENKQLRQRIKRLHEIIGAIDV